MMTLNRLKALSDSYGADLLRWPAEKRRGAEALLRSSGDARQILAAAAETDALVDAASRAEQAVLWSEAEEVAAVTRLRAGIAGRIAQQSLSANPRQHWRGMAVLNGGVATVQAHLGWLGFAASGGLAVVAGATIGALSAPSGLSDGFLALLQTSPLHVFPM